ncbi:restriction endonuclease subunit S [Limosilactobacillus fermentum]
MTPEQLKASILQQAMEGKLVKQDPNDEPASVLVKKIADEKAQLIQEKKIKRTKKLPAITDDEKPFDIPDSWEWVRLGTIFDVKGGKRVPRGKRLNTSHQGKPYLRVADMVNGSIKKDDLHYADDSIVEQISKYTISSKDLYFSIAGTIGKVGQIPNELNNAQLTENAAKLVAYDYVNVCDEYFVITLESNLVRNQHKTMLNQMAQPKLALFRLKNTLIPLPPLSEQKRIVDKIEKLMPLVDKYAESYNQLAKIDANFNDRMKQSILQYAMEGKLVKQDPNDEPASVLVKQITDEKARLIKKKKIKRTKKLPAITDEEKPFDIPDSWEWIRFGDLVNFRLGKTPQKTNNNYWSNGVVPWVAISDMQEPTLTKTKLMISDGAFKEVFKQRMVPKGTLLMSFKLSIGKVTILNINAVHNEAIIDIQPYIDNNNIQRNYLFCVLPFISNMGQTNTAIKGKTLNKTSLNNMVIPLPPLAEQKRIVDKVEQIMNLLFD